MDAMIETIVSKLRRLSASKLQVILEFVNFMDWQEGKDEDGNVAVDPLVANMSERDRVADWQAFINEYAGAFPDFPTAEEIRAGMGQDAPREDL
ncbi:MAG: hypothetical protein WBB01_00620 [Phormidesmis sp.]